MAQMKDTPEPTIYSITEHPGSGISYLHMPNSEPLPSLPGEVWVPSGNGFIPCRIGNNADGTFKLIPRSIDEGGAS